MLRKNPEITPLSIASSPRKFIVNASTSKSINIETNLSNEYNEENEEDENSTSTNILKNRSIRKRKSKTPIWIAELIEQREKHHRENYQRERFLSLLEKHLKK